jgi:hypothetical protein
MGIGICDRTKGSERWRLSLVETSERNGVLEHGSIGAQHESGFRESSRAERHPSLSDWLLDRRGARHGNRQRVEMGLTWRRSRSRLRSLTRLITYLTLLPLLRAGLGFSAALSLALAWLSKPAYRFRSPENFVSRVFRHSATQEENRKERRSHMLCSSECGVSLMVNAEV